MSGKRAFQRYVLLSEDAYRGAVRCMEKEALARATEHSAWFERDGALRRIEPPDRLEPAPQQQQQQQEQQQQPPPDRLGTLARYRVPSPNRVVTRAAGKKQQKGSGRSKTVVLRVY
jgi:hypothetical protein